MIKKELEVALNWPMERHWQSSQTNIPKLEPREVPPGAEGDRRPAAPESASSLPPPVGLDTEVEGHCHHVTVVVEEVVLGQGVSE